MLTDSPKRLLEFMGDVVRIAKFLSWHSKVGNDKAQAVVDEIHKGKYGAQYGIWPQTEDVMYKLKHRLVPKKRKRS